MNNIANKPNILFTKFENTSDNPKPKKTSAEEVANFLLTPVHNIFGYTKVTTDGNKLIESTKVTAKKIDKIASVIFAILLFPVAAIATITGFVVLLCSKSHNALYSKIFNSPNPREGIDERNPEDRIENKEKKNKELEIKAKDTKVSPDKNKVKGEKLELLEKTFWEDHFKDKDLHRLLELVIRDNFQAIKGDNSKELKNIGSFVVDHYINYKATKKKAIDVSKAEKEFLVKSFQKQLINFTSPPMISEDSKKSGANAIYREIKLPNGTLKVYETGDDGSCGFHALLGEPVSGKYTTDAVARREEFCQSIRKRWEQKNLPDQIENVLKDYFSLYPNNPSFFTDTEKKSFKELHKNYQTLSPKQKDKRFEKFLNNKTIFEAYLGHMSQVGTYITQDELEAVAICSNRTIRLYQPGWGNDAAIGVSDLNPGNNVVEIYYNGINHYERAEFVEKKEEQIKEDAGGSDKNSIE